LQGSKRLQNVDIASKTRGGRDASQQNAAGRAKVQQKAVSRERRIVGHDRSGRQGASPQITRLKLAIGLGKVAVSYLILCISFRENKDVRAHAAG
jgi:hypothetical protein